jgi:hypothetical protein
MFYHVSSANNGQLLYIYTVWCVQFWHIFLQLQITFEDRGWGGDVKASHWPSTMQNSADWLYRIV